MRATGHPKCRVGIAAFMLITAPQILHSRNLEGAPVHGLSLVIVEGEEP